MAHTAQRVGYFTESVIREMTRLNNLHGGVNLAQGFPDFPAPAELIAAAERALRDGFNQYAITWGSPNLRRAIADKFADFNGVEVDPDAGPPPPPRTISRAQPDCPASPWLPSS